MSLAINLVISMLILTSNVLMEKYSSNTTSSNTVLCIKDDVHGRPDVGFILFPSTSTCQNNHAKISEHSVWFGYRYDTCHANFVCGKDCGCIAKCGSHGYTIDEFNNCYKTVCGYCNEENNYMKLVPDDKDQLIAKFYIDKKCNTLKPGNFTSDYYQLHQCNGIDFGCDYTTSTWVETVCPKDSGSSTLESFFF